MNICIFEDFFISNLAPINYLRHTSELICGAVTIKDKIEFYFKPKSVTLYSRNYLAFHLREKFRGYRVNNLPKDKCLFLSSRALFNKELAKKISSRTKPAIWSKEGTILAIYADGKILEQVNHIFSEKAVDINDFNIIKIDSIEVKDKVKIIEYPSDIILFTDDELNNDIKLILKSKNNLHISQKC
ncbi:MAG TPA: putative sugar nucleotidyl transferase, partial [Ignavibacteria bacterium]